MSFVKSQSITGGSIYENNILNIDEVYRRTNTTTHQETEDFNGKNPVMVEAGKKAAITRKTATYTLKEHFENLDERMLELFNTIRDYIISLDSSIEETPKKNYIAYKTSQNFVCLQTYRRKLTLYLKLNPEEVDPKLKQGRDVRNIGHFGTGDFELTINDLTDFEETKELINEAYKNIGG
jgi:predicted transport protein